jgi:hypothetical protein
MELMSTKVEKSVSVDGECWVFFEILEGASLSNSLCPAGVDLARSSHSNFFYFRL